MQKLQKPAVLRILSTALLVVSLTASFLPLFQLYAGDRLYRVAGWQILLSSLSYHGQIIEFPWFLKLIMTAILLSLAVSVALLWKKRTLSAALAACTVSILALLLQLAAGSLANPLETATASKVQMAAYSNLGLLILTAFLAALLILWSRGGEALARSLFLLSAAVSVAAVLLITLYMLIAGLPAIVEIGPLNFLFGTVWDPTNSTLPQYGILPFILATLAATVGAILIGVPVGLLTAVFLAEIAPARLANLIRPAVELLAGIPSVIFGFFGLQLLVPVIQKAFNLPSGATLFTAILILSIMILPTIVSTAENGLRAVPGVYREASLAVGATRIETIFKVMIPAARSAILSGVILGVGRAIGETMAIIMVAGNIARLPELFGPVRPLTVGISLEMGYASGLHQQALFSIGLVLFAFIMIVNLTFSWISRKGVQMDAKK